MTKISQLSDIGANLAGGDEFVIRDVSDAVTPNKKVTSSGIIDYVIGTGSVTGFTKISAGAGPLSEVACTFSGSTGTITMGTASAGSPVERLRIDSSGRVGIGASSPGAALDVVNGGLPNCYISTNKTDATTKYCLIASQQYSSAAEPEGVTVIGSELTASANNIHIGGFFSEANASTSIVFSTASSLNTRSGSERLRIDSSGNVGIGTSSPTEALSVTGNIALTTSPQATITVGSGADDGPHKVNVIGGGVAVDFGYYLNGTRRLFSSTSDTSATIVACNASSAIAFFNGTSEVARLNGEGELLVGYTADNGAYKLQVNSQIFATSATVATSDGRYKENVATLGGCLDLVKALRPVSFTWKPQEDIIYDEKLVRKGHNFPDGTQVGFIAQEVQEALVDKPWLNSIIKENIRPAINDDAGNELAPEEQFFGIAEGNLIAVLTNALQEAIAKIETLEAKVAALEAA